MLKIESEMIVAVGGDGDIVEEQTQPVVVDVKKYLNQLKQNTMKPVC